jgi:membrane protein YdbS with pleckstrin-like domain
MKEWRELLKAHVGLAVALIFDTLLIILMLLCFFVIDHVIHYCGFENEMITTILHIIVHPVVLLVFFFIFIINILKDHLFNNEKDSRFEILEMQNGELLPNHLNDDSDTVEENKYN